MLAVQSICTLQLLVSTALLAKVLATYNEGLTPGSKSPCEKWDETEDREYNHTCGQLTGGVVSNALVLNCNCLRVVFFTHFHWLVRTRK